VEPPTWTPGQVDPDGGPGVEEEPVVERPGNDPAPSSAPQRTRREPRQQSQPSAPKTATETRTTTAPAPYNYRCWNGRKTYRYADCSAPTGRAGAGWVFSRFDGLGCSAYDVPGTGGDREAWVCRYGGGNQIVFARWGSPQTAKGFYRGWFARNYRNESGWYRNSVRYGVHIVGRSGPSGNRAWKTVRIYEAQPWTVSVKAGSIDGRERGTSLSNGFRPPNRLKGVPIR
jgi:hypothetical protein